MRICRFNDNRLGLVMDDGIHDVSNVLAAIPASGYPLPTHDLLIANLATLRPLMEQAAKGMPAIKVDSVKLLSPVANPGKIIAAPVNYTKHLEEVLADKGIHHGKLIDEIQRAGLFLKATSSLVGAGAGVDLVHTDRRNDHEVELAVVIGKTAKNVNLADALSHVAGYSIGLDITIRGPEDRSFRKSPDSYCVLGPWLVTADELPDPSHLDLSIKVNGEVRQQSNTSDLILNVQQLIVWASSFYTLHPGDVIITGTPQGVGPIKAGDVMDAHIQSIGAMRVAVRG
jgi:2-keto-4-pentenoate hydratase/2-oxohepta-3-ene-1,7-dioic acid hydratase in catechol pathway